MQKIISLSKRRGFIFPSSEIYGGFGSVYDFGPLGALLKINLKNEWIKNMREFGGNVVLLDSGILMTPKIWEASGHLSAGFADELVECMGCKKRFKQGDTDGNHCPECGKELLPPRKFNLMMRTSIGPVEDTAAIAYLRAETCQGIFVNFKNVLDSSRVKIPFGIAQIGKSFRNEITPGNFIFRMREFEQMEMEWFCQPKSSKTPDDWFEEWKTHRLKWYLAHGISQEHLRFVEVEKKDRSHYAQRQVDLEYHFPFGWKEIEGIHNRGDWDLSNHAKFSGQDLQVLDEISKTKYYPHVIETSVGVERSLLAFLCESYEEVKGGRTTTTEAIKDIEINLNLHKTLAPIKVAVLPLVKNKENIVAEAQNIFNELKSEFSCQYDETGTIGKRYRRQDEIGTPFCLTVDFDSLDDGAITLRNRETMAQERIPVVDVKKIISEKLR